LFNYRGWLTENIKTAKPLMDWTLGIRGEPSLKWLANLSHNLLYPLKTPVQASFA
jgi:hypothetical protein